MPHAYVAQFNCKVEVEKGYINETLLNDEICEDKESLYYHSKSEFSNRLMPHDQR